MNGLGLYDLPACGVPSAGLHLVVHFPLLQGHGVHHGVDLKIIGLVGHEHELSRDHALLHAIEDDVDGPGHDPAIFGGALHGVRLARARDSVGEQQTVLPIQELLNQGQSGSLEHGLLRGGLVKHALEGELGGLAIVEGPRRLGRDDLEGGLVNDLDTALLVGVIVIERSEATENGHVFYGAHRRILTRIRLTRVQIPRLKAVQTRLVGRNWSGRSFHPSGTAQKKHKKRVRQK